MSTSFETFWSAFENPTNSLSRTYRTISKISPKKLNVEMVEEFILNFRKTNTNLTTAEECVLGEMEIMIDHAKKVQEESEQEWENIMNNPEHPLHSEYKNKFLKGDDE